METTCYLQVEPEFSPYHQEKLWSIRVKRVTQKKPDSPLPGSVVVKLKLDIADVAFLPLAPEATITIPVEHTEPIVVTSEPIEVLP